MRGPLFIAVRGPLTIAAPPVAGHRLQTRRLSSCGARAQLLRGMWDLPRPGLQPVSPALAGRFSTTAPPGKPPSWLLGPKAPKGPSSFLPSSPVRHPSKFFHSIEDRDQSSVVKLKGHGIQDDSGVGLNSSSITSWVYDLGHVS